MGINLGKRYRHFIDTETTGLNPLVHELLEVAVVTEEVDEGNPFRPGPLRVWVQKVKPNHLETATAKALEVNGYTPEDWSDAVDFGTVAQELLSRLEGGVLVGHNIKFDLAFLESALLSVGVTPKFSHHSIDTVTLAYEHWGLVGDVEKVSLDTLRTHLGIPVAKNHTSLKDALDCRTVFHKAMEPKPWKAISRYFRNFYGKSKDRFLLWTT
jgi:DNA polymerase III epsilon subunit-like protein